MLAFARSSQSKSNLYRFSAFSSARTGAGKTIPLIKEDKAALDTTHIPNFIMNGNCAFTVKVGFSIEYQLTLSNSQGKDNTPVRFVRLKRNDNSSAYCGVIYCNPNNRFYYHTSTKSIDDNHVHEVIRSMLGMSQGKRGMGVQVFPEKYSN